MSKQFASVERKPRRRFWRRLLIVLLLILFLLVAAVVGVYQLLSSQTGRDWLVTQINKTELLHIGALEGNFWDDVVLRDVAYHDETMDVTVDYARWRWRLSDLRNKALSIPDLEVHTVSIVTKEIDDDTQDKKSTLPSSLTIPLKINIDQAVVQTVRVEPVTLENVRFSLSSTGMIHYLDLQQINVQSDQVQGEAHGALALRGEKPFIIGGQLSLQGRLEEYNIGYETSLEGDLSDLHLIGYLFSDDWFVTTDGRFDVLAQNAYSMLHELTFSINQVDLQHFSPDLPRSSLSAMLTLTPPEKTSATVSYLQGEVQLENAEAGAIDAQKIPVTGLNGRFELQEDQIAIYDVALTTLGGAQAKGLGWLRKDHMNLRIQLENLDLVALQTSLPKTQIDGEMLITGDYDAPKLAIDLDDQITKLSVKSDLALDNLDDPKQLMIRNTVLQYANEDIRLEGDYQIQDDKLTLAGQFEHLNPEKLGAVKGDLNGSFDIDAAFSPDTVVDARFAIKPSTVLDYPLSGEGKLQFVPTRLHDVRVQLNSGATEVHVEGALGAADDVLNISALVPDVRQWYADAHGKVTAQGTLRGTFDQLALALTMSSDQIALSEATIDHLNIEAETQLSDVFPFSINANIKAITASELLAQQTKLVVDGNLREQRLQLNSSGTLQEQPFQLATSAQGTLDENMTRWQGELSTLMLDGALNAKLQTPMSIDASTDGITLGETTLAFNSTNVHMKTLQWHPDYLRSEGEIAHIDVAEWLDFAGLKESGIRGDLVLSADWRMTQQKTTRDGTLNIQRKSGDLQFHMPSRAHWQPLNLAQMALHLRLNDAHLAADAVVESGGAGIVNAKAEANIPEVLPDWTAIPFSAQIHGDIPDLSSLAPLLGNGIHATGNLKLDLSHEGTLAEGIRKGSLTGNDLSYRDDMTGIALNDGIMKVNLADNKVVVEEFVFKGGRGDMHINGEVDLSSSKPVAQFLIVADRMRIIRSQEMLLVVTGRGDLTYNEKGISLSGQLRTNYGNIHYRDSSVPSLSDDVVVVGEQEASEETTALAHVEFDVDLGNHFRLRGYGVDTKVKGTLKLRARPNQGLNAYGSLQTFEGSYRAYGQNLNIERGIISFLGQVDNPTLDILAIRDNSSVNAGVMVKGTAKRPTVSLYSEPSMPTNEALSWLLFDHGSDSIDGGDSAILFQVLNAMLAGEDSSSLTDMLFGGVIDEVNLSSAQSSDGESTQVVTVGKKLSKDVSLALEKSFNGLQDAVRLTWRFARRWSLVGRFGTDDSSANVNYSIRFN